MYPVFGKDLLMAGEVTIEYCLMKELKVEFFTKPL